MAKADENLGAIRAGEIFALPKFMALTGLKTAAIRQRRKAGFKTLRIGSRTFVTAEEFLRFAKQQMETQD